MSLSPSSLPKQPNSFFDTIRPFVFGGISGSLATSITQPIDTIKVQIQVIGETISNQQANNTAGTSATNTSTTQPSNSAQTVTNPKKQTVLSTNPITVAANILKTEGIRGFYKGLDAAILRQITYGTTRLGLFRYLSDSYKDRNKKNPSFGIKALFSMISGFTGCLVGNPADLALVRCQRDSLLPPEQRRNYKNVGDALTRIVKEEGFLSLWKGSIPTICRAISMNMGMLATYDQIKEMINSSQNTKVASLQTQSIASAIAGVVCSMVSLPFDNAKTKLQGMKVEADGKAPYKNIFDCMKKTAVNEGVSGLWVGLPTFIFRVSPHAIAVLLIQDFLHQTFNPEKSH